MKCLHCRRDLQAGTVGRFCSTCRLHVPIANLSAEEIGAAVEESRARVAARRNCARFEVDGEAVPAAESPMGWRNRALAAAIGSRS